MNNPLTSPYSADLLNKPAKNPLQHEPRPQKLHQPVEHSQLYQDVENRVLTGGKNDYIIAVSANPRQTGVSGTGKTTFALRLAKTYFDQSPEGYDATEKATLDVNELVSMYDNSAPRSAIIYDEAQGTPSGTGLNAKRTMKEESLTAINTVATRRKDRVTLIVVTQNIKTLVTDLYDFVDAWLLIQDDRNHYATHYEVNPDVFDFETRKTETPGVEDLTWDPFAHDDPDYRHLNKLKDVATDTGPTGDEETNPDLPIDVQAKMARVYNDVEDIPWRRMGEADKDFTYSGEYLRQKVKDMAEEDGEGEEE